MSATRAAKLVLDGFGSGPTSLSRLREWPVSALKIDPRFVGEHTDGGVDECMVGTILQLGRALGCSVIADGVESAQQLATLLELGCDAWQGPLGGRLLARPRFRRG